MASLPSERKALLCSTGGVRLAVRLSQLREILEVPLDQGEVVARGETIPSVFVGAVLGLAAGGARYALVTETAPRSALRVEALHGIVDLAAAEVFQLPARTPVPQPSPFAGAIVAGGRVALELAVSSFGFAPIEPVLESMAPPASMPFAEERELCFARGGLTFAVPLPLLVQVIQAPAIAAVPLAPASHRGLLYHGRAIHPVYDVAVLYGQAAAREVRTVLLLDAGGAGLGVAADRVLGVGEGTDGAEVLRPAWDALFGTL